MKTKFVSRLYHCIVTHVRDEPIRNIFKYSYVTFCLDLDEVEKLQGPYFGKKWWNIFRFKRTDFIFGRDQNVSIKQAIQSYALTKGVDGIERIELIAHMRTLGVAFNPAAFYFCYGKNDEELCIVVEVTNTYYEKKTYFINVNSKESTDHSLPKEFYVSPFVDLDSLFEFKIDFPKESLKLEINSVKNNKRVVSSIVVGNSLNWNNSILLTSFLRFPFITIQVLVKIHYQAFVLYMKKVHYFKKNYRIDLQKGGIL